MHPKQETMSCALFQNFKHFFPKSNMLILKQIVWETQKWH